MNTKMLRTKNFLIGIILMLCSCMLTTLVARGEGSTVDDGVVFSTNGGNHGVNRVIRTNNGFTGVEGTVSLAFSMPKNATQIYETAKNSGMRDTDVMPFLNKPTAYLGGEFTSARAGVRTQVDIGLQLEPLTVLNVGNSTQTKASSGWSIFFNLNPVVAWDDRGNNINMQISVSPRTWDATHPTDNRGMPYRGGLSAISGLMSFTATSTGAASFSFASVGNIFATLPRNMLLPSHLARWHVDQTIHLAAPWADSSQPALVFFNPSSYATANVKRVAGMTREDNHSSELDGSQVVVGWSGCRLQPNGNTFRTWGVNDVDQHHSGFDAPRLGDYAYDKRYNAQPVPNVEGKRTSTGTKPVKTPIQLGGGTSRSIIQFSDDPAINDSMLSPKIDAANDGRYASETVTINLDMAARPLGSAVH